MNQLVPLDGLGQVGMVTDVPPYQIPPTGWSDGSNVRFDDISVRKSLGYHEVMATCPFKPKHLETYQEYDERKYYWIAFGDEAIAVWDGGGSWHDVTPDTGLSGDTYRQWQTTKLGAILIATNGVDKPIYWPLNDVKLASMGNKFVTLPNWPEEYLNCQTIAGFKSFVVAGSLLRDDGIRMNRTILWSHMTNQYTPPDSWDVLDPDKDAGEYELLETEGPAVHTQVLRESLMVYKTDSIYNMAFVGAPFIFSFKVMSPDIGIMCKNACADFPGGHFFVGQDDCYVNNGQTITPMLTQKVRRRLFENIDGDAYLRTFCVTDHGNSEVWTCFPSVNSTYCDQAIVWNYVNNTFSFRSLPELSHIKYGVAKIVFDEDWDEQTQVWDSATATWGTGSYDNVVEHLVFADPDKTKIYRDEATNMENGAPMHSWIERTGIDLGDPSSVKHVKAIWPKIHVGGPNSVKVSTGFQMSSDEPVTWDSVVDYDPDTMSKISVRTTGKFFGIRIESEEDINWSLSGIEYELSPGGRRGSRVHV